MNIFLVIIGVSTALVDVYFHPWQLILQSTLQGYSFPNWKGAPHFFTISPAVLPHISSHSKKYLHPQYIMPKLNRIDLPWIFIALSRSTWYGMMGRLLTDVLDLATTLYWIVKGRLPLPPLGTFLNPFHWWIFPESTYQPLQIFVYPLITNPVKLCHPCILWWAGNN